jgi:hypothetical protein
MKALQSQMSSGVAYYEGEFYNVVRQGRGVPAVPLVLIGIEPWGLSVCYIGLCEDSTNGTQGSSPNKGELKRDHDVAEDYEL